MDKIKILLNPVFKSALKEAIIGRSRNRQNPEEGRFTKSDIKKLIKQLWLNYDELIPEIPEGNTFGSKMSLILACVSFSFFKALLSAGIKKDLSIELISDTAWVIYRKWGQIPRFVSWLISRDPLKRLRISTNLFRRFPFNPPGYIMEDVINNSAVSFNVLRCPIAEYFISNGTPELCTGVWCNLDYGLAEMWGGKLKRGQTLASGSSCCDFNWGTKETKY